MNEAITTALTILASSGITSLLLLAANAYFTEKGKGLATRQDIAKITREVEKVKEEFARNAEHLRADLQLSNQLRFTTTTKTHALLLDGFDTFYKWRGLMLNRPNKKIGQSPEEAQAAIRNYEQELNTAFTALITAKEQLTLFINDADYFHNFGIAINFIHGFSPSTAKRTKLHYEALEKYKEQLELTEGKEATTALEQSYEAEVDAIYNQFGVKWFQIQTGNYAVEKLWRDETIKKLGQLFEPQSLSTPK